MKDAVMRAAARTACRLPLPIMRALSGPPISIDGQQLDPVVQFMVKYFTDPPGTIKTVAKTRENLDQQGSWLVHKRKPGVDVREGTFGGPNGPVPYASYRNKRLRDLDVPVMVFFHGGGHTGGSVFSHDGICHQLAHATDFDIISIEYRLAPDHKFPAGVNDCLAAYDAIATGATELRINPRRIAVGGDSAGANLAAMVAQQRKSATNPPQFQLLWVPWVDMSKQTQSYELFDLGFFLEKPTMEWFTANYINDPSDALDPRASPMLGDVEGVCPAALLIAGFDPLRDEGLAYGEKLKAAGVETDVRLYEDLVHPFINVAGFVPAADAAFDDAVAILKANL